MIVTLQDGSTVNCQDEAFGGGKDGATYWTADGEALVKLYHQPEPWRAPTLENILGKYNAVRGEPYWEDYLCWPKAIVKRPRLGVLLPRSRLKPLGRCLLPKWLKYHPEDGGTWSGRLTVSLRLARAVRRLHFKGLCHSDLSENNVFADPNDGRAYVIDCDGLVVPGYARPVVGGTTFFMAPEIVEGKAGPSVEADLHSLAVLIYFTLFCRHPLQGQKIHHNDPDVQQALQLGERALFIEHPTDLSNRPQRLTPSSSIVGSAVQKLFHRAFVDGLHQPKKRPQAADWERDLVHLLDTIVPCPNPKCQIKAFPLPEFSSRSAIQCPWPGCGARLRGFNLPVLRWCNPVPGQLGVYHPDGLWKVAWPDVGLHEWHIRPNVVPGPTIDGNPLAYFARHVDGAMGERWFLVNDRLPYFEAADPSGPWKKVRPREAAELKPGRKLRFGPPGLARDAVIDLVRLN